MSDKDIRAALILAKKIAKSGGGSTSDFGYHYQEPTDKDHIFIVHGGDDFDKIDKKHFGSGEPGGIRPLGHGLYGFVVNPSDPVKAKEAIEYAKHYSNKYGKGKKTLHVFKLPKTAKTISNGPPSIQDMAPMDKFVEPNVNGLEHFLQNRVKDKAWQDHKNSADLRMESLPSGKIEASIHNPSLAKRVGKFPVDADSEHILGSIAESTKTPYHADSSPAAFNSGGRIGKSGGGSNGQPEGFEPIGDEPYQRKLNALGLYSKAAEIAHTLPQKNGSLEQFISAVKTKGAKPAEIDHAGDPELNRKTTNKQVGYHFERNSPALNVVKLGGKRPQLTREETDRMYALSPIFNNGEATPEQAREFHRLTNIANGRAGSFTPTKYHDYKSRGINGDNYREHLITIPSKGIHQNPADDMDAYEQDFQSNHWDHPNVIAHVRMQDTAGKGKITDDDKEHLNNLDAATSETYHHLSDRGLSDSEIFKHPEFIKIKKQFDDEYNRQTDPKNKEKTLHVDEVQSDWGQQGREVGFYDPEAKKAHEKKYIELSDALTEHVNDLKNKGYLYSQIGNDPKYIELANKVDEHVRKRPTSDIPKGPYVQNTQHWTDLALKHILHEAAKGDYDKIQFATGKENADRYGLENHFKSLHYDPSQNKLSGNNLNGELNHFYNVNNENLKDHIGSELAEKLLAAPKTKQMIYKDEITGREKYMLGHHLFGDDLIHGGEGMRKYYDQMIPKSMMKQIQQHDPDIKPDRIVGPDSIERFGISMTPKAKESIKRGQTMFARGGAVNDAIDSLPHVGKNRNGVPEHEAVASPLKKAEYPYHQFTPAKSSFSNGLIEAINKAHKEAKEVDLPIHQLVTDVGAIGKSKIRNPSEGLPFVEKIAGVHHLRDGNHRAAAAMLRGDKTIKVRVADMDEALKSNGRSFASGGAVISEAQKHAGNYKKEHINFQGLNISIENAKGSTRSGKDKNGKSWSVRMPADYGYIKGTSGADGDHVDTYVGPNGDSDSVFVVDQKDLANGRFDEHKVMLGFKSLHDATEAYKAGFSDDKGAERMGHVARLTIHEFKNWLKNHNTTKPMSKQSLIDKALLITQSAQRSA